MNARIDPSLIATPELYFATIASGQRVPYAVHGTGEPLVFVHGSLCDYRYWDGQVKALSKGFLCVSVSLGHYWPSDEDCFPAEFSWKAHVREMAEFIAAMNLGPVHLVGHSRGGCVAYHLAREYPELVKSLVLADPGGPLQIDGMPPAAMPAATIALREEAAALIGQGQTETGLELFIDSVSLPGVWRRSSQAFRTMAIDNAATLPMQFRDPLPAYDQAGAREVKCATLLLEGAKSPRMYRDNSGRLVEWIARARKHMIEGASHGMNVTHPATFNRLIAEFVNG
ncbi:alpha/beta hydrolase [Massilia sp. METH4]|uniref:alpha/beta fold hydrolase n=1 Tax=Massilia sp. METH4 TaxID=3123041 RepID=UPI0030CFD6AE